MPGSAAVGTAAGLTLELLSRARQGTQVTLTPLPGWAPLTRRTPGPPPVGRASSASPPTAQVASGLCSCP
eukprot:958338-Lingulodinium_polyedra.AAC.1